MDNFFAENSFCEQFPVAFSEFVYFANLQMEPEIVLDMDSSEI